MIRKYLFWIDNKGIKAYKVINKGCFAPMKPQGKEYFPSTDLKQFFKWFNMAAAITEDEFIDFCFLSEINIESPLLSYTSSSKSSWDKEEIYMFCEKYMESNSYKIFYNDNDCIVNQTGNIYDKDNVKKLFLKCIPEFSIEASEEIVTGKVETSFLNRYFIDKLKEL